MLRNHVRVRHMKRGKTEEEGAAASLENKSLSITGAGGFTEENGKGTRGVRSGNVERGESQSSRAHRGEGSKDGWRSQNAPPESSLQKTACGVAKKGGGKGVSEPPEESLSPHEHEPFGHYIKETGG